MDIYFRILLTDLVLIVVLGLILKLTTDTPEFFPDWMEKLIAVLLTLGFLLIPTIAIIKIWS
jgi:hypothetical protein